MRKLLLHQHLQPFGPPRDLQYTREIPSTARFLFQLIMRRKRAGAVKGKEKTPAPLHSPKWARGGRGKREKGGIYSFTHKLTDKLFRSQHRGHTSRDSALGSGPTALRNLSTLIMRPSQWSRNAFQLLSNFHPPKGTQFLVFFLGGRSEPKNLFILAQTSLRKLRLEITVVRTWFSHELTRVAIVLVPSLLRRVERTCVGVALGSEVEDRVNSRGAVSDSDHDRILIRTHNVCYAI